LKGEEEHTKKMNFPTFSLGSVARGDPRIHGSGQKKRRGRVQEKKPRNVSILVFGRREGLQLCRRGEKRIRYFSDTVGEGENPASKTFSRQRVESHQEMKELRVGEKRNVIYRGESLGNLSYFERFYKKI